MLTEHRARSASRLKPVLWVVRGSRKARRKACGGGGRRRHRLGVLLFQAPRFLASPGASTASGYTNAAETILVRFSCVVIRCGEFCDKLQRFAGRQRTRVCPARLRSIEGSVHGRAHGYISL